MECLFKMQDTIRILKSAEQWGNFLMLNVQDALIKLRETLKSNNN